MNGVGNFKEDYCLRILHNSNSASIGRFQEAAYLNSYGVKHTINVYIFVILLLI